ncbi:unnamed protein product [Clavelina lepadiformis]|uniref:Uncharacterized protein n=1 Tax=Clavelina lepadiformis TaxID=159417 RepID=A0ABP0G4U6_CLALP
MKSKNNATAGGKSRTIYLKKYAAEKNKDQASETNKTQFGSADDSFSAENAPEELFNSPISSSTKFLSEVEQALSTSEDDATSSCSEDFSEVEMSPWDSMVFNSTMEYCVQTNQSKRKYSVSFDNDADVSTTPKRNAGFSSVSSNPPIISSVPRKTTARMSAKSKKVSFFFKALDQECAIQC